MIARSSPRTYPRLRGRGSRLVIPHRAVRLHLDGDTRYPTTPTLTDRIPRAISLVGGIEAPTLRHDELAALATNDDLLTDSIAYGEVLALLAGDPETLARVTADAVTRRPALANASVPDTAGPVTARERRLVEVERTKERDALLDTLAELSSDAASRLRKRLDATS